MSSGNDYYELYRRSSIGLTLVDTLDDMVNQGRIEPQLAMKVVSRFDRAIAEVLTEKVKARMTFKSTLNMLTAHRFSKGHLDTYRFCDEVWTFLIKDVNFKLENGTNIQADKIKIVSCNAKKPGET